jgi:nitroimidazol reductase NimA-like FMN-containing flavoprotein (pyridoxamine 5'-phosphate oxidase superfamily)
MILNLNQDLKSKIIMLLSSQKFAVLSTQNERQPYSNLIAFAECEGCKEVIFFTPKNTSKYANLLLNKRVALLVDNRTNQSQDFNNATALTLIGSAEEINTVNQRYLIDIFIAKHPNLADIINSSENALFKVNISDYIVATFDKVVRVQLD